MDDRARRIVDTAVELAERGGFEAVRLRDVAASSGVALGTLYRHFRSKEDLLVAALSEEVSRLEQRMAAHPATGDDPLARVFSFFKTATSGLCRRPMLAQAVLRATASGQPELTEKVASFQGRMIALITDALRGNARHGNGGPASKDDATMALVLQQVWFASLVGWGGGLHGQSEVIDHVRAAASMMLG
jgi:AcrR family transcriptional regulator